MTVSTQVLGRERTSVSISASDYRYLELHEDFWKLAAAGVATLERTAPKRFALKASSFVGHSLIGDCELRIEEKIPGALAGLLEATGDLDARIAESPALADRQGRVIETLAERFLDSLSRYLLAGREKRYVTQSFEAGLPRGKVDLGRTMRLRARGRADLLAFRADVLSADLTTNRLLGLGLQALDHALGSWRAGTPLLTRARTLGVLFEDIGWTPMTRWSIDRLATAFEMAMTDASSVNLKALLSFARVFALHFGIGPAAEVQSPVSWFVNLEALFEDAVRAALRRAAAVSAPVVTVTDWRVERRHVLETPHRFLAEPDVVISTSAGSIAILDAKYKEFNGRPDAGDVYQLLAHARAYGVRAGVLIYPSASFDLKHLGTAQGFCELYAAQLSLTNLVADGLLLLEALGIVRPVQADISNFA
jgi:5-methylcytosine-specific restriction endonuclease McrBC regulatory subunit McrC